ncbi:MAG: amidohydrolase family protein [Usitatibacter sp.]
MPAYKRIATEEAWSTPEVLKGYEKVLSTRPASWDPGFYSLWGHYLHSPSQRALEIRRRLVDLGSERIADMDASGIDMQVLMLTAPGVQVFDASTAVSLSVETNNQVAEAINRHPTRYRALAAFAPQDPKAAAKELERAVKKLGLKGGLVNSHTMGEYLDDEKFWEIFEAAESLDVPIYIHPQAPPPAMVGPYLPRGLDGAVFGFAAETGLHAMRMVFGGVFDRFPKLKIVLGHLGEGLPFWHFRLDYMHAAIVRSKRYPGAGPLKRKPSDYLKENFWYTTSGMQWQPAILFCQQVLGMERVMYAMDYPYQFAPEEVKVTDDLPISDADKKKLYQGNAEELFAI